jgi:hypothetical protein
MYKKLTSEGLKWVKEASKDMKKRTNKKRINKKRINKKRINKKRSKKYSKKGGNKIPKKYTARLSKKDKAKQTKSIKKAIKSYKKGKYIDRPKLKSYKSKKSSWVKKFEDKYGENIKTYKEISRVTGVPVKALKHVVKKGKGAYYSSGSRPNQTAESWGKARMYSYILGGPTRKYDDHITEKYNVKLP